MEAKKRVLLIGIDPSLIDFSRSSSGRDAGKVKSSGNKSIGKLTSMGFKIHKCIVDLGETAGDKVLESLKREKYDCIMIGGGMRVLPQHTELFEEVINIIHQHAPEAKLCFNAGPEMTVEAVLRCMYRRGRIFLSRIVDLAGCQSTT